MSQAYGLRHSDLCNNADQNQRQNYLKQAKQIRVALLQSKEYLEAAKNASLYTSPNHLYYSMNSLATAMMMLLGDGSKSIDFLRRDSKNANHGLKFTTGANQEKSCKELDLLKLSQCEILPSGHFSNWYSILPKKVSSSIKQITSSKDGAFIKRDQSSFFEPSEISTLISRKFNALGLIEKLPDLAFDLNRYGFATPFARMDLEIRSDLVNKVNRYNWIIHGIYPSEMAKDFLNNFEFSSNIVDRINQNMSHDSSSGAITLNLSEDDRPFGFEWPTARETMHHESISYMSDIDRLEIVDMYLIYFQLSILSRYYPDLWITCLESQCKAEKVIELCVSVIIENFPILALSIIYNKTIYISSHIDPLKPK